MHIEIQYAELSGNNSVFIPMKTHFLFERRICTCVFEHLSSLRQMKTKIGHYLYVNVCRSVKVCELYLYYVSVYKRGGMVKGLFKCTVGTHF